MLGTTGKERRAVLPNTASHDDHLLISAIAAGDSEALAALYYRYGMAVQRLALRYVRDHALAEEIVQELFWRVWRRCGPIAASRGHVAAWIFAIARRLCIDELRRTRRHWIMPLDSISLDDSAYLIDLSSDTLAVTIAGDQRTTLIGAMRMLPLAERQAIGLIFFGGLTFQEAALQLRQPVGTTKSRVYRGLRKLKTLLGAQFQSGEAL